MHSIFDRRDRWALGNGIDHLVQFFARRGQLATLVIRGRIMFAPQLVHELCEGVAENRAVSKDCTLRVCLERAQKPGHQSEVGRRLRKEVWLLRCQKRRAVA